MKFLTTMKTLGALCIVVITWTSCQKEVSVPIEDNNGINSIKATGMLPDDPAAIRKVPGIISSQYAAFLTSGERGKDTDKDGIPDTKDACRLQPETYNGYQDTDGCPDTVPPPTSNDTDGDGILNTNDQCPSQAETFNGYQDTDGCPDTVPAPVDTDGDGILDYADGCPTQPETFNGYLDEDGCPDNVVVIPDPVLPASVQLQMPPVGSQGSEGSCVAWAVAYYARSTEAYYRSGASSYNLGVNVFSPEFLFNQTRTGYNCGGSSVLNALDFTVNNGICTWQSMPYTSGDCSLMPTSQQTAEASAYRISSYSGVSTSDITAIKTLLSNKHPLLLGFATHEKFNNATSQFIWSSYGSSIGSTHQVTICGYDDAKQAVKIFNSWGTSWGDGGYSWISYSFLPQLTGYIYVMNP